MKVFLATLASFLIVFAASAEKKTVVGKVYDKDTKDSLVGVLIQNIYSGDITTSDSLGNFKLSMEDEELIEFRILGYNTARLRMRSFLNAKYYSIGMTKTPTDIRIVPDSGFYADSVRYARFYSSELSYRRMTTAEIIYAPWEYFSKTNQAKWHLQDTWQEYIADGYINQYFNEEFIQANSDLEGLDLQNFMRLHRPSYQFARSLTKYEFMLWIKRSAERYHEQLNYRQIQTQ